MKPGCEWDEGVEASHAELEVGDYVVFDSDDPYDVVRWLYDEADS